MQKYEIRAGDQVFACSLNAATEAAALDELAAAWQRSFRAGSNRYDVPGSEPATSIDLTPGQLMSARRLDN